MVGPGFFKVILLRTWVLSVELAYQMVGDIALMLKYLVGEAGVAACFFAGSGWLRPGAPGSFFDLLSLRILPEQESDD